MRFMVRFDASSGCRSASAAFSTRSGGGLCLLLGISSALKKPSQVTSNYLKQLLAVLYGDVQAAPSHGYGDERTNSPIHGAVY